MRYVCLLLALNAFFAAASVRSKLLELHLGHVFKSGMDAKYFTQMEDHFDFANNGTFPQRYYVDESHWKRPDGPVFIMLGGEAPVSGTPGGFVEQLAAKHGALLIAIEHRFFGESVPNRSFETANLRLLSSQQALADYAAFVDSYQRSLTGKYGTRNTWISFGGSYPGALSAWFRLKYPHLIHASLASSGVVNTILDFVTFDEQIAESAGPTCAAALREATAEIERELASASGEQAIKSAFRASKLSTSDFYYMIADSAVMAIQYGNTPSLCVPMTEAYRKGESTALALANFTLNVHGPDFSTSCFYDTECLKNTKMTADLDMSRSWWWMKCAEVAYFQTAPAKKPIRSQHLTVEWHLEHCKDIFGEEMYPRADEDIVYYGGAGIEATRVFYYNGWQDPWQRAGKTSGGSHEQPVCVAKCKGCGHCQDLHAPASTDPKPLQVCRERFAASLQEWLA